MADPVQASQVLDALRPIIDPDFKKSIVDLGFIKDLQIDGTNVSFAIELTTPACPVKSEFERAAHEAVSALEGVEDVAVTMTSNTRQAARSGAGGQDETVLPGVKNVVAVASGKGGVGKSTTAVNLALALRDQGAEVGLLDADVYGPSLSLLTGVHQRPDTTPDRKIMPVIGQGMKLMSMAFFMTDDSPVIWRGPMVHGLVKQFLTDVKWGELDYLIVDMPPGTGDAALTLTQMAPLSGAVIVTTANDLSLIDARKGLQMFEKVGVPILGIIENMAYFTPPDLPDRKYYLFGQGGGERVARELDVDFLGEVPIDPRIAEEGDLGRPIVSSQPDSPSSVALREISGVIARKLAMLAVKSPPVADANITWVS
ncbi:MAG TPA: Mrp/NBP35 family ATP-binding protein [Myxococcota bacterium]|nr:Mrp/NBP35 family ATP-binding protein [Myxococcota bacterium]